MHGPLRARPVPLYEQIRESLRAEILGGTLRPHQRIPSEKDCMRRFDVSRITVRQALGDLERDGLIFRVPGKGSYVAKPKPTQQLARLQGFGEAMAQQGYTTTNRVVGVATQPATEAVARRLGIAQRAAVTEIRRIRAVDRVPISFDVTYVRSELGACLARENLAGRDIFAILENDYGIALGHADQEIQALAADAEIAGHLGVAPGDPLLHIARVAHTRDGEPIELDYVHYRGDAFRYRLRIERDGS